MKLRNKKTGEIVESGHINVPFDGNDHYMHSLAELCEEWEDYKEPNGYWFIDSDGEILQSFDDDEEFTLADLEMNRLRIGNYFETKEEAERAVWKLKALRRLKGHDLRFTVWSYDIYDGGCREGTRTGRILFDVDDNKEVDGDLDLLFGGEDE